MKNKSKSKIEINLASDNLLDVIRQNYKELSKKLPGDIQKLEKEIDDETAAFRAKIDEMTRNHDAQIAGKKNKLGQLKQAMKGLPELWSLEPSKEEAQQATALMHTGQKLRELREKRNWSQRTLGEKMKPKKAQAEISRYERTGNIPDPVLANIAKTLEVPKTELTHLVN